MPSANWLKAARNPDRVPVLWMCVESIDAVSVAVSTREEWEAGPVLTNVVTDSVLDDPGVVIMATDGDEVHSGTYDGTLQPVSGYLDNLVPEYSAPTEPDPGLVANIGPEATDADDRVTSITFNIYANSGYAPNAANTYDLEGKKDGGAWETLETFTVNDGWLGGFENIRSYTVPLDKGQWTFRLKCPAPVVGVRAAIHSFFTAHETLYLSTASLQTISVDLGAVPTVPSVFAADDRTSATATLAYTAQGSNNDADWTNLGAVVDGGTLAAYRYYRFTAAFTSTGPETPILRELGVSGGDSQFKHFSTHENVPVVGSLPLLKSGIGSLTSKLELMKLGSTGEVSPKLIWAQDTFELLRDGELRNKAVSLRSGFIGLAAADYAPVFTGLWHDATITHYGAAEVAVKTRTILARFQKAQIPAETGAGELRTADNVQPKEWINANIIDAMLDIIEYLGIPNRWVDLTSADAIRSGARSSTDWLVSRRMDKDSKEEAIKLLEELSVLAGVFILPQPDGKMLFKLYDPDAEPVAEITTEIATFSPIEMGQAELFTRQQIFYEPRHEGDLETGNDRGEFADATDYSRNDSVTLSTVIWYCLQSHKSSADTAPGIGGNYRPHWTTAWLTATTYAVGDVRISGGPLYTCILAHTSGASTEPGRGSDWRDYWTCQPVKAGNSDKDFHSAYILINSAAEIMWGLNDDVPPEDPDYLKNPGYQKKWYDKWNATPAAIAALAARMDSRFANPKMKLKTSDLHPDFDRVGLGDIVGITGLMLPIADAEWGVPCSNVPFMVMSKTFDTAGCKVSLDLLEV